MLQRDVANINHPWKSDDDFRFKDDLKINSEKIMNLRLLKANCGTLDNHLKQQTMNTKEFNSLLGSMTTLSEVTNLLNERGYTKHLNLKPTHLVCQGTETKLFPGEFIVDKHYRFEGPSDPGDEAIVFAISSSKHHLKGVLINGYGVSSETISDDMIKALDERNSENRA